MDEGDDTSFFQMKQEATEKANGAARAESALQTRKKSSSPLIAASSGKAILMKPYEDHVESSQDFSEYKDTVNNAAASPIQLNNEPRYYGNVSSIQYQHKPIQRGQSNHLYVNDVHLLNKLGNPAKGKSRTDKVKEILDKQPSRKEGLKKHESNHYYVTDIA